MSNAKKCDRCEKFYEYYEGFEYIKNQNKFNCMTLFGVKSKIFDLCPLCMKSLFAWLDDPEQTKVEGEEE